LEHKLQLSWMRNYRKDVDDPPPTGEYLRDWFDGRTQQADWYMIYRPNNTYTVTTGLNYLRERGESYYYSIHPIFGTTESIFSKSYAWTKGVFIENKLNLSDKFFATAGIRLEDHSRFDTSETYKIDALYSFDTGTKLKGTFATGFKAPSLYQLYVPADASFGGGNANLQPEENETYEVGIEQSLLEDKLSFGTTYFHTIFKNLIDTTWNTTTGITEQYKNVGKAKAFGYESQIRFQPFKKFKAIGNYTWLDTEDKDTHDELLRRAKNKFDITLDYSLTEKLGLASTLRYVGHRQDSGGQLLKAYTRVDISTNYDISEECNIFGRIENLFNEKYEEIKGYQTPGFSVYVGTKYSF